jgi:uncharacterized cupredoxin-like copper-binding protein
VALRDATLRMLIDGHDHPASVFYTEDGGLSIKPNSVTSRASVVLIFTAMKSSNLKSKTIMNFTVQHFKFV